MDLSWNDFLLVAEKVEFLVVDTEADTTKDMRVSGSEATMGVTLATVLPGTDDVSLTQYYPVRHQHGNIDLDIFNNLKRVVENTKCLVFHNAKYDLVALQDLGINFEGKFYDTMIMEHFINGKQLSHKLTDLSRKYGGDPKEMPQEMAFVIQHLGWRYVPPEMMSVYSRTDGRITYNLFKALHPKFKQFEELWEIDQQFIRTLIKLERFGVRIDKSVCKAEYDRGTARMRQIRVELDNFNPNSGVDLNTLLIEKMQLPVIKRSAKTNKPSFDKKVMEQYEAYLSNMQNETATRILEYRGWMKTTSSNYRPYLDLVSCDGRLRPNFEVITTVTTRLSCRNPNLQQIPRTSEKDWNGNLKAAFIPATGYKLWECDYSQLEFRIIASYAGESELIAAFNDPRRDVFSEMAERLGWERQNVKTFVYMVSYGAGILKIRATLGVSEETAREMKDTFYSSYPQIGELMKKCMSTFKSKKYIKLWTGRQIRNSVEDKPYAALDYLAQGGGAEIVKRTIIALDKFIDWKDCRMVLQVHDAIVFEIREGEEDKWLPNIKRIMEDVDPRFGVKFPVECKVWGTNVKYNFSH
jgi:DNA polymerase-1